jgi:hypothetical protein
LVTINFQVLLQEEVIQIYDENDVAWEVHIAGLNPVDGTTGIKRK